MSDLANLEALLNICANGTEIFGIGFGGPLLLTSFIPHASGLRGYTSKIIILSTAMVVVGLGIPSLINMLKSMGDTGLVVALIVGVILALVMAVLALVAAFLPTIIAVREKKKNKVGVIVCNILGIVPLLWVVAFIWACIPEKRAPIVVE